MTIFDSSHPLYDTVEDFLIGLSNSEMFDIVAYKKIADYMTVKRAEKLNLISVHTYIMTSILEIPVDKSIVIKDTSYYLVAWRDADIVYSGINLGSHHNKFVTIKLVSHIPYSFSSEEDVLFWMKFKT